LRKGEKGNKDAGQGKESWPNAHKKPLENQFTV
jgi:hypothetical protein